MPSLGRAKAKVVAPDMLSPLALLSTCYVPKPASDVALAPERDINGAVIFPGSETNDTQQQADISFTYEDKASKLSTAAVANETQQADVSFTYEPFLDILGTGLVTSEGESWKRQRLMVSAAFRIEILDDIVDISTRAADRVSQKLAKLRGTGESIDLAEELTVELAWQRGDVAIVDNFRVMHGRRPFQGERRVLASLVA